MRKSRFSKRITIAISPTEFQKIQSITDKQEISIGEFIRMAIKVFMSDEEKDSLIELKLTRGGK